MLQVSRCE